MCSAKLKESANGHGQHCRPHLVGFDMYTEEKESEAEK